MEHKDYKLAAIVFTDIVGFSRMMEEDEPGTLATLAFHNKLVQDLAAAHRGRVIKTIGDAVLMDFPTALDAVTTSLEIQRAIAGYNEAPTGKPLTLRIGIHLGDIYFYENDALGEGINIASRLQAVTKPGRITISREVYSQVSGKIPMRVESLGQVSLKNISREVHAYELIPEGEDNNTRAGAKRHGSAEGPSPAPGPAGAQGTSPAPAPSGPATPPPGTPGPGTTASGGSAPTGAAPEDLGGPAANGSASQAPTRPRDFASLKAEWHVLRDTLKSEFKKVDWEGAIETLGREVADFFEKSPKKAAPSSPTAYFENYKAKFLKTYHEKFSGFFSHVLSYAGVVGGLMWLNLSLGISSFPWSLVVAYGWGIGLASHAASLFTQRRTKWELDQFAALEETDARLLKTHQKAREGFWTHLASNTVLAAFLMTGNFLWGWGSFPWSMIVAGALGLGLLGHLGSYIPQKAKFSAWFKDLLKGRGPRPGAQPATPVHPAVQQAWQVRDTLAPQLASLKSGDNPLGEDFVPVLDNYVKKIEELAAIETELQSLVRSFPLTDLQRDQAHLTQKAAAATSLALRQEYERSLGDIDRQTKSYRDLQEQQEILGLRLQASVKQLRQLQIDVARIKGTQGQTGTQALEALRTRSDELSHYITDYREGLKEL